MADKILDEKTNISVGARDRLNDYITIAWEGSYVNDGPLPPEEKAAVIVTVAGKRISLVGNCDYRNYAGIREMVYALEGIADDADNDARGSDESRVEFDDITKTATIWVKNRRTGRLVSASCSANDADTEKGLTYADGTQTPTKGFMLRDGRFLIGVRALAEVAGIDDHLIYYTYEGQEYVYLYDPAKTMPDNIYQLIYLCPKGWSRELFAYFDRSEPFYSENALNMYNDYEFGFADALNWLMQTRGNINFVFLVRCVDHFKAGEVLVESEAEEEDISDAVEIQYSALTAFINALNFLKKQDNGGIIKTPKFYVGSTEHKGYLLAQIYENVISKLANDNQKFLADNPDCFAGLYYGKEEGTVGKAEKEEKKKRKIIQS